MAHIDTSPIVRASVWIPVTDPALHAIDEASRVARHCGGGPVIKPHLTLLMGIETTLESANEKLRKLAIRLQPFTVQLGRVDWRHEYFRCLFVTAEPSEALTEAHRLAHEIFEMNPPDPFEPHVSLIYGDIDERLKRDIAAELGGAVPTSFTARAIQLVQAAADRPIPAWNVLSERPFGPEQPPQSRPS